MSVKIKISYQTPEELNRVIKLLSPDLETYRISKKQSGSHKNAYAFLKNKNVEKQV